MNAVRVRDIPVGPGRPLLVIAGPCVLEEPDAMLRLAGEIAAVCRDLGLPYCFKSSYSKDNRTSADSYRGPGLEEGLRLLERIGDAHGVPLLTDIHPPAEAAAAAAVVDVLQIPAFLCRQTSLLEAAGATGRVVNIKKGQFLAPADLGHAAAKARRAGAAGVLATERGSFFGYRDLVVDFRSVQVLHEQGLPVVFDATHSVQSPGSGGGVTGGRPELVPLLVRCGMAAGADALFLETHPDPPRALSDAGSQLPLGRLRDLLETARRFHELYREVSA